MLKDLKVLNGTMSLKFDPLNTIYTIFVDEKVNSLEIKYKTDDNATVKIEGNKDLDFGKNEIVLTVKSEDKESIYHLYVYKEDSKEVILNTDSYTNINIEKNEVWEYAAPVISVSCFLVIIITFTFLFHKQKNPRKIFKFNILKKIKMKKKS